MWFKRRRRPNGWTPLPPIQAKKKGADPKQRSLTDNITNQLADEDFQEDSIYQMAEIARIFGGMPRPNVENSNGVSWGGFDCGTLRIAGLCRSVLIKLNYHHVCTPAYCLLNRASCRFFFPWPQQTYQVYDENTQRLALRRALCDDDQWVVPHNLSAIAAGPSVSPQLCREFSAMNCNMHWRPRCLTMFSTSSVNVIGFDPNRQAWPICGCGGAGGAR